MFTTFLSGLALFAADNGDQGAQGSGGGPFQMLLFFAPVLVLFYFLLMRPQQREQARRRQMLANVKKNDRVITSSGIYGVVTGVQRESDEITIRVDEKNDTKLRMSLSAIAQILADETAEEKPSK